MPEFDVKPGVVSYLGTVFYSQTVNAGSKSEDSVTDWAWQSVPNLPQGRRQLAASFPEASSAAKDLVSGWVETSGPDSDLERLRKIKSNSTGFYQPSKYGVDGFYFGSQNGVVKRWRSSGSIELLDTGADFVIDSVLEVDSRTLMAGGEAGTLKVSLDAGRTWVDRSAGLPWGIVHGLLLLENGDVAFAVSLPESVAVFEGKPASGDWKKLGEFPLRFATWTGMRGVRPELFRNQSRLFLTLPSNHLAVLNPSSQSSQVMETPGSFLTFKVSPDGVLRCTCTKAILLSPYESHDLGKTWTGSDFSRYMVLPEFRDGLHGVSAQLVRSPEKSGINMTADGGKTWQFTHVKEMGVAWWSATYSDDGSVILLDSVQINAAGAISLFLYSRDDGKTWQLMPTNAIWAD
jgi:hypothetical protein